ncbi:MAG: CPCC family cysteine-rich protein [Thermoanaerobaculia bacterium]
MRFACLCCGHQTLDEKPGGTYEICPVCFWEDDNVQADDPDFPGGANAPSLRQAQVNFRSFGACEERFLINVRSPRADEPVDPSWVLL